MSDIKALRATLTEIDRLRTTASDAEHARTKIRLSQRPVARKGLLGFLSRNNDDREMFFTEDETAAIYRALGQVRDDCSSQARRLESEIEKPAEVPE